MLKIIFILLFSFSLYAEELITVQGTYISEDKKLTLVVGSDNININGTEVKIRARCFLVDEYSKKGLIPRGNALYPRADRKGISYWVTPIYDDGEVYWIYTWGKNKKERENNVVIIVPQVSDTQE